MVSVFLPQLAALAKDYLILLAGASWITSQFIKLGVSGHGVSGQVMEFRGQGSTFLVGASRCFTLMAATQGGLRIPLQGQSGLLSGFEHLRSLHERDVYGVGIVRTQLQG